MGFPLLVVIVVVFLGVGFGLSGTWGDTRRVDTEVFPGWVFGVVWGVLFVLQAVAFWTALRTHSSIVPLIILGVMMGWVWIAGIGKCDDGKPASLLIMGMGMLLPFLMASVMSRDPVIAACLLPTVAWLIIAISISAQH